MDKDALFRYSRIETSLLVKSNNGYFIWELAFAGEQEQLLKPIRLWE